ncbi:MAG: DUF1549 domain-containing protein, partial [Verrucomicrobiota bacterium]
MSPFFRHFQSFPALLSLFLWFADDGIAREIDFTRDVRPIFSENCFHCHGFDAKARKAGLRMDDEVSAKEFIIEGKSAQSELVYRLITDDPDDLMPPANSHRTLTPEQIQLVKDWIDQGAEWGGHWAFERVPEIGKDFNPTTHPIDQFVKKKLEEEGLTPTPRAAPHTLVRRAALDLTGLAPTPEQVSSFSADPSQESWEKLIDEFLSSDGFGVRMAWDWLEVSRYADTNGYQGDRERTMWPWRDWVVRAFNE